MRAKILIVDDVQDIRLGLENRINWMGHDSITTDNGKDALRLIEEEEPDLVLLDLELPLLSGLEVLHHLREMQARESSQEEGALPTYTAPLVVILTAFGTIERAVQAMKSGAFDFLTKPYTADHLTVVINKALSNLTLRRQVEVLQKEVGSHHDSIVGSNSKMAAQLNVAKQTAPSNVTVLLLGETGTGKEVVARAIHQWSPRRSKAFIPVNCAALPENLLENELFGHERGAFTGAVKREPGKIEVAEGGTLFLDEIGDMPLTLQAHLLRVLTDQNFYRIGGTQAVRANVRFIAATNRDLQQAVHKGSFREDLFYRLAVISITLPPLRERLDDLPALVKHFLGRTAKPGTQQHCSLSETALKMLQQYSWPGNIRELENVLMRAIILCPTKIIEPEHLSLSPILQKTGPTHNGASTPVRYHDAIEAHSRMLIEEALRRNGWNQTKTADELGLQRTYLTKLLRQKGISGRPPKGPDPEGDTGHTG